jgi:predicted N-formylglutamate amidohydrolase
MKCEEAFCIAGEPEAGGILVVSDHASNLVPDDIDLGIDPALLSEHVAIDIGVAGVAQRMVEQQGIAAFLANVSRLVCDCNRDEDAPAVIPHSSDGHAIPGNLFDIDEREERLERFFRPYHRALADLLDRAPPRLIVGDQQPYSGKLLNATMNRHAEAHRRPYFGIEIRQDQIGDEAGQAEWAERLVRAASEIARHFQTTSS